MRNLIGIIGISLLITGCDSGTDIVDGLADLRTIEWWAAPWRGASVPVAVVHPDATAGPGPHPVIINLTWGDGSAVEVEDMIRTYWLDEPPTRGYYVVAPEEMASAFKLYDDLMPAIFDWMDGSGLDFDPEQVVLVGASNGGRGVFYNAVDYPDRFAALVGMPGRYEGDGTDLDVLANKPILLLVGENDASWVDASQTTFDFLEASGANAELEIVEGQGHILSLNMVRVMDWIDQALGR